MKHITFVLFTIFYLNSFAQTKDTLATQTANNKKRVSFITKLDIANASKDGIHLNGYVVNIDYEKAEKLDGKTIRVTGKVTVVRGLKNTPGYDPKKDGHRQGREGDTKHILSPKIEIITE